MATDFEAHATTDDTPLHKAGYMEQSARKSAVAGQRGHLEQSPRDSTDCGQNSPATCRRSVQSTAVSMNSDVGTYCNPTSSHNTMQKGGCRQESAESFFLLVVGVAVQNRSCRLWGSMAGAVSAFVCHAILEGSIQQSLPHCAYSQLRRLLKWTQT